MTQATSQKLILPPEGALSVALDFLDLELVNAANEATNPRLVPYIGGFVWSREISDRVTELIDGEKGGETIPEPLRVMARAVIDNIDFSWRSSSFYVRHIGTTRLTNKLSIHTDGDRDMRVLVEGHSARWIFDQPYWTQKYPHGLALQTGAAVVLNNLCTSSEQLRHGVITDEEIRSSYLFNFQP